MTVSKELLPLSTLWMVSRVGADERAEHELAHGTAASTEARMLEAAGLGDQQAILDTEELGLLR